MSDFKQYKRTAIAEMRPVTKDDTLLDLQFHKVSVSNADLEGGSPRIGDMVARNPHNHKDMWLVAETYFNHNFEEVNND